MRIINKRSFLAELGKLLTFMDEDDRQTALDMYGQIFDEIDDDQFLTQQLMSPTRQAVVIARAYDSRTRRLQGKAGSRQNNTAAQSDSTPKFVTAIRQIEQEVLVQQEQIKPHVLENQMSMFDAAPSPDEVSEDEASADDNDTAENNEDNAEIIPEEDSDSLPDEDAEDDDSESSLPDEPEESSDPVDAFISGLTIDGIKEPEQPKKVVSAPVKPAHKPAVSSVPQYYTERKAIVPLLVLYILFAIPIGLLLLGLLVIPTAISLSVACVAIGAGAVTLTAAFSGFAVFADILIVLGCALLLLAVGLLFLWLFVWFIGGVMVSLVKGIIHLGDKLCYKEVAA